MEKAAQFSGEYCMTEMSWRLPWNWGSIQAVISLLFLRDILHILHWNT